MDVLLIIAERDFQPIEFANTKAEVEKVANVKIASTSKEATSAIGEKVTIDLLLEEVKVEDYDAIIFIGGPGAEQYFSDAQALKIAKAAFAQGKIVAAICVAPIILANAGILQGKNATVWDSGGEQAGILQEKGAIYTGKAVEKDGKIITANGPAAAKAFGKAIADALKG